MSEHDGNSSGDFIEDQAKNELAEGNGFFIPTVTFEDSFEKTYTDMNENNGHIYESFERLAAFSEKDRSICNPIEGNADNRQDKCKHVIQELVDTEEDFLQDVRITIDDIMKPLLDTKLSRDVDIETLFGNIEDIERFSSSLLLSLREACNYDTSFNLMDNEELRDKVGQVFISHISIMTDVYKIYCRNHDDAITLLEKYENEEFRQFQCKLIECLNSVKKKVNAFDLGSFLIKPVQRILKYPLLLQELLKTSKQEPYDARNDSYYSLMEAINSLHEVANTINEVRRRKDLVRKYRKGSQEVHLTDKISRLSLHSVKKKSARISLRLSHATGINQPDTVDLKFNEIERDFKDLEKAVKLFLQNSDAFLEQYQNTLSMELLFAEYVADLCLSDQTDMVLKYNFAMRLVVEDLSRCFQDETLFNVHSPLSSLLAKFKGPQALIDKRFDKLLDYENCLKSPDTKEKTQMAKNVYEALNHQLLDELPKFCELGFQLLQACIGIYIHLQREFQLNMLKSLQPVLEMGRQSPLLYVGTRSSQHDTISIVENYKLDLKEVVEHWGSYIIVPNTFNLFSSPILRRNSSKKPYSKVETIQTDECRMTLLQKYKPDNLYTAIAPVTPPSEIDLSCITNQLFGVIKKQDPLGNVNKWLCDNGATQGFLPSRILRPSNESDYGVYFAQRKYPQSSCLVPGEQCLSVYEDTKQVSKHCSVPSSHSSGSLESYQPIGTIGFKDAVKPQPCTTGIAVLCRNDEEQRIAKSILANASIDEADEMLDDTEYGETATNPKKFYRVEFPFTARTTLELSVQEGDMLTLIVPHDLEGNAEWWLMADNKTKQGYVPANYMVKAEYL